MIGWYLAPWITLASYWGWSLVHAVWMLAVIAAAAWCALQFMKRSTANARYIVLVSAMLLMATAPPATLWWMTPASVYEDVWTALAGPRTVMLVSGYTPTKATPSVLGAVTTPSPVIGRHPAATTVRKPWTVMTPMSDMRRRLIDTVNPILPWMVAVWAFGVLGVSCRLTCGAFWVLRTRNRLGMPVPTATLDSVRRIREALGMSATVRVLKSTLVETPMVLGWLKPIILLPPSALTGLTPRQLEMVLAHELAHLVRYDHVINAFQAVVEAVLFYHPAVWWVSRRIREERELCCDDRALALSSGEFERADAYDYACALAYLESERFRPALGGGISATGGPLLQRIQRMLSPRSYVPENGRWATGLLLLVTFTALLGAVTLKTGSSVLAEPATSLDQMSNVSDSALAAETPSEATDSYTKVTLPTSPVGVICVRRPGASSYYDWREVASAEGNAWLPENAEYAIRIEPGQVTDLSFLDALPIAPFSGLLLGAFPSFRAGNDPPEKVYPDVLQTEERTRVPISDDDMIYVTRFTGLKDLYLDHARIGDSGVAQLASLPALETLSLVDTEITDESLQSLCVLPALKQINLAETAITDRGLAYLAQISTLEDITLDRTAITDAGLAALLRLRNLRRLSLNFTAVTDAGVARFGEIPTLTALRAWHTRVTPKTLAIAGHATGPLEYGRPAPRVGIVLSDFNARTGKHWMPYEYTYRNSCDFATVLIDLGYDLYAVIEPNTEDLGYLPQILQRLGLEGRTLDGTKSKELEQLDVVFSGFDADVLDSTMAALTDAIKAGVGFVNTSLFGVVVPEGGPALSEILGIDSMQYRCPMGYVECPVVNSHPILGDLQPGDTFVVSMLNGYDGKLRGTPLLGKPADQPKDAWPLYVYDLGKGHVVNLQCQRISITNGEITPLGLYGRCVNFAAGVPVDATW